MKINTEYILGFALDYFGREEIRQLGIYRYGLCSWGIYNLNTLVSTLLKK